MVRSPCGFDYIEESKSLLLHVPSSDQLFRAINLRKNQTVCIKQTHLQGNGRIVIRQCVPLSTDELLCLIPWLWELNVRLERRCVEPSHREYGRRVIQKVPIGRVAPPPDRVVRRCQSGCDRRQDPVHWFLGTRFNGSVIPMGQSLCSERFSLAVELEDLGHCIWWSSFRTTHDPLEAWNGWLPRFSHSIKVLLTTIKEVQLQLESAKSKRSPNVWVGLTMSSQAA